MAMMTNFLLLHFLKNAGIILNFPIPDDLMLRFSTLIGQLYQFT